MTLATILNSLEVGKSKAPVKLKMVDGEEKSEIKSISEYGILLDNAALAKE